MADMFVQCGVAYSGEELDQCRNGYAEASDPEVQQCGTQTAETVLRNLQLKAGTDDPCDAVRIYGAQ